MYRRELNREDLNLLLLETIRNASNSGYHNTAQVFFDMYKHGFRFDELERIHEANLIYPDSVYIQTAKRGHVRLVSVSQLTKLSVLSIQQRVNMLVSASYDTYLRDFKKFCPVVSISCGGKELALHAFRHNWVKKWSSLGLSNEYIKNQLGLKDEKNVLHYLNSKILVEYV